LTELIVVVGAVLTRALFRRFWTAHHSTLGVTFAEPSFA
jgi:hypothetical protein